MSYILKDIDTIVKRHFHIDNGGHTLAVDTHGNVYFHTGFFGYTETTLKLETNPVATYKTLMVNHLLRHLERAQGELAGLKEPADDPRPDELLTGDCGEVYKVVINKYGDITLVEGDGDVILYLSGHGMSGSGQRFIPFLIEALTEAKGKLIALAEERPAALEGSTAPFSRIDGLGWIRQQGGMFGLIKQGKRRFYWTVSDTSDFAWEGRQWTEVIATDVQVAMTACLQALSRPEPKPAPRLKALKAAAHAKFPSRKRTHTPETLAFRKVFSTPGSGWWQTESQDGLVGLVRGYSAGSQARYYWGLSDNPKRDIDQTGNLFSVHVDWHPAASFEDARDACIRAVLGEPTYPIRGPIQLDQFPTVNPDPTRFPAPWSAHDRGQGEVHVLAADGTYVLRVDTASSVSGDSIKDALLKINGHQYPYGPDGGKYPADWQR